MIDRTENRREGSYADAAYDFGLRCAVLATENLNNVPAPLNGIINDLMTELWDRNFSQSEIRAAFLDAVKDLPRYAAGEERRSRTSTDLAIADWRVAVSSDESAGFKDKEITSLLLYSFVPERECAAYLKSCLELVRGGRYSHDVPPLQSREIEGQMKCIFDFSSHLSEAPTYDPALSNFVTGHEKFICDIVSLNSGRTVSLSALLTVDESLGMFGIKMPRLPASLCAFDTFEFEYTIWHTSGYQSEQLES